MTPFLINSNHIFPPQKSVQGNIYFSSCLTTHRLQVFFFLTLRIFLKTLPVWLCGNFLKLRSSKHLQNHPLVVVTAMPCLVISRIRLFVTPWLVTFQAPLSLELSRQEYWSVLPGPPPGDLPNPGIEPRSPALQADSLPAEPPGKPRETRVGVMPSTTGSSWHVDQTHVTCFPHWPVGSLSLLPPGKNVLKHLN